ncbi:MAG: hybrid sensor histidine kinase/response regulator [Gemmatimonadetes bacterium]|nr:hybrid sensor histidine kinase/response regulator [Gemmatimonadota bacterium]MBT5326311.1 hybrid sensor histidine kinase/response regulator [Gemmatimonadota bacterium]MBT5802674.1 hybrid sensor histidine kinase/response regulator [Gemmatimonadota bacterium]MBT6620692.1 hybrid sensor histidine kinase/response regulator [Gemmatimonadota bacterium]MBT6904211.1 hybrid sensor histidine kinase/response regulator [Gemmatimonadota bacterium]
MTDYDDNILQAFIEESQEHLDGIENDLLRIEAAGAEIDDDLVNEVFRAVHSIKGGSSFLGLENITELAHGMESVLNMVRNRQLVLDGTGTSVLLASADVLAGMLADTGSSDERDIAAELEALQAIPDGGSPAAQSPTPSPVAAKSVATPTIEPTPEPTASLPVSVDEAALDEALEMLDYLYLVEYGADEVDEGVLAGLEELGTVLSQVAQGASLFVLFATVADVDVVASLLELEEAQVRLLEPDQVWAASPVEAVDTLAQTPVLPVANGDDLGPEGMLAMDAAVGPAPEVMRFLNLTYDLLNKMDQAFEVLLRKPGDVDALANLFDAVHRIKIAVGEQGLTDLDRLLGAGEDVLNRLRAGGFGVEAATAEILLDMASLTGEVCAELESDSLPEERDITALVDQLLELAPESEPEQHRNGQADAMPPAKKTTVVKSPIVETSLRVHVRLLDRLMNLAGELVLTRNQLKQVVALGDGAAVERTTQRLDQVTTELQETVVSTRMQPVGSVFGKFRRIVRDIARDLNKDVELVLEGEEVELDKTIIEALSDPLTHLVRNALDHGIETPSVRYEQGKQPTATLLLRALHEAGQVIIEITDNGAGIDPENIRTKALSMGNYDTSQINSMGDRDLVRLIFHPGFSTVEEVTDISGRGVGMDVVLTNLTKLGGIVDIDSEVGRGTTVRVKLPLTLAIIPALLVGMGSERFAVPQVNLAELVRVPMWRREELVQELGNAQVLRLRGNLLPLISLRQVFSDEIVDEDHSGALNVLVLKAGDFRYGMIVDELLDSEEIVVKPLDDFLSACKIYAGATILGDGQVAMILDVIGISDIKDLEAMEGASAGIEEDIDDLDSDVQELLLVYNHPDEQLAVPVSLVSRIERIHCDQIQRTGTRASMQYLGGHLVLFSLEDAAAVSPRPETDYLYVLVFTVADHEVGLLVSELVDITSQAVDVSVEGFVQAGIMGSTTISGRTTLMVDLYDLVRRLEPTWIEEHNARYKAESERTILIVEDTAFFRNQLERFVVEAGYRALVVEDGAKALAELERRGDEIDLILTDIEMPEIDGLELARRVRVEPRFAHLPIIAVTSLGGEENERRGRDAGVDEYLIKINREQILQAIRRRLGTGSLAL